MENKTFITLERHEEQIKGLKREVNGLREIQSEIRMMNKSLVMLANELKHTNEHLARHETRLEIIESVPRKRWDQLIYAIIGTMVGMGVSLITNIT